MLCLLLAPRLGAAATVELPLHLRIDLLQRLLADYLSPPPERTAVLFQQGACRYLRTDNPRLEIRAGRLYFTTHGSASLGIEAMGNCPASLTWKGTIEVALASYVDPQWRLRYRIIDSKIVDEKGAEPKVTGFIWDFTKRFLHPRLEGFAFDLAPPRQEIVGLLRTSAPADGVAQLEAALGTMTVAPIRTAATGLVVPLKMTVADSLVAATAPLPQAPLNPAEIETFQKAVEPWDAFLVFAIKMAGADVVDAQMRAQLFDFLIASRYQLLPILAGEAPVAAGDPVRRLFVDSWQQLRRIFEEAGQRGLLQDQVMRYMTFVSAGDALLALDAAAPGLGLQISSDGLRQLARTLQPGELVDPLHFDWQVDPVLRELFGFAPEPALLAPEPSLGRRFLDLLIPMALAAESGELPGAEFGKRLDRWVPGPAELEEYRVLVTGLLQAVAAEEIKRGNLDARYAEIYQHLVLASGLVESCWRQFVRDGGQVSFLRSQAGSIGLMQVNQHVWRGFYDLERLRWEVAYNAQAGAQILMRYLKQYGIAVAEKNNEPNQAPRATYSVYNAGPRAARRFMNPDSAPREKRVDGRLWDIYQGIAAGGTVDLTTCRAVLPAR
ncbi:MAG: hypothetical protein A2521_05860 [Deltaproteobacteria bacterium RIFOXYD12_FULL_57_12]|nr:MAG: hypothetical protein A2521_05860 [Deltaproteobacteria bacterium RIFOXYD12_FULL_57_12]